MELVFEPSVLMELKLPAANRPWRATLVVAGALTLVAAPPRLINLGSLSFYADEETSAMPARSLAEGNGPRMPSGMVYRRALPLTWLNAATARVIGTGNEVAYRLPAALLGICAVPLLFLAGCRWVGRPAAMVAALGLAVSEWHVAFSRMSRMYVPFLAFFVAAGWAIWDWAETGRRRSLYIAIPLTMLTVALHQLGILVVLFAILPVVLPARPRAPLSHLVTFATVGAGLGFGYHHFFVSAGYQAWPRMAAAPLSATVESVPSTDWLAMLTGWSILALAAGVACGTLIGFHIYRLAVRDANRLAAIATSVGAAVATILAWSGQIYGAAMLTGVWLIMFGGSRRQLITRLRFPLGLTAGIAIWWLAIHWITDGPREALKAVAAFPYPYPYYLAEQFPVMLVVVGGVSVVMAARRYDRADRGLRTVLLAAILPLLAIGAVSRWGGTRLLFPAYPFLLLAASVGLVQAFVALGTWTGRWSARGGAVIAAVLMSTGLLGGHGVPQVIRIISLEHGDPVNPFIHMYPFRPDHRAAGEFVRRNRKSGDVVIAEDPLQQWWYAGAPIQYWLRSYEDSWPFLYQTPDGSFRDIYVSSELLQMPDSPGRVDAGGDANVWLITSGETYASRSYYLNERQRTWLDSLELVRTPSFVSRDGVTKVYCINCPSGSRE